MEILGIDIGFGFTKATSGSQDLIFKSVLGESTDIQFREQMLPTGGQDADALRSAHGGPPIVVDADGAGADVLPDYRPAGVGWEQTSAATTSPLREHP